ncbi:MBL fold metallo-hydrolase [Rhizobium chutanense]|uniref:MBL fold metallo-hydrolase n=1 Tax=Rhizobium chutanense TaxID=2035448 RepID=A0A2A6J8D4_9HYPH|nr:MBL fold metallo-hydrolase [Rhizobium chutanense]PDT02114.1 MBL fold metallo-hydrolase [Rhizobium chutanense]
MESPVFDLAFEPAYGRAVPVVSGIARVTAENPGPFTFFGTNSYLVGTSSLAIIDPGPEDEAHYQALMAAIGGRDVTHIFVSHTHRDHSPLARRLQAATGAVTAGQGPHRPARRLRDGEVNPFAESSDVDFVPDLALGDGERIAGDGWSLRAVLTPGHTANHAAFALEGREILLSGDHVMAWSTSIVAPPDGSMANYMASLDKLITREDALLLPGHGGPVREPKTFLPALKAHRLGRERAVLARVAAGDSSIAEMVKAIYHDTDPKLYGAAALSVLAHIEDLVERGEVAADGPPSLAARYRPG